MDNVIGGAAAPQRVVVHCRQIVMNQRVRVDELDGACGGECRRDRVVG
jgi:hypothetical protein